MNTNFKPIVSLEDVSFSYNHHPAIQEMNLSIYPGKFIGIIGPNGSGKTTILKLISGILTPQKEN